MILLSDGALNRPPGMKLWVVASLAVSLVVGLPLAGIRPRRKHL
jgi:hypothetical protein